VKLPEKGTPELSGGEVPPKKAPPTPPKPAPKKAGAPVIETGPIEKKDPKKILKYVGLAIVGLLVLGGVVVGYLYIRNMTMIQTRPEEPEVQETTESVVIEEPKEDKTSLKALENKFDEIEDELVVLEKGATFDREIDMSTPDF